MVPCREEGQSYPRSCALSLIPPTRRRNPARRVRIAAYSGRAAILKLDAFVHSLAQGAQPSSDAIHGDRLIVDSGLAPNADWAWLRRILARLRRMATPARDDRARLMPALALHDLANTLMRRTEAETALSPRRRALSSRNLPPSITAS